MEVVETPSKLVETPSKLDYHGTNIVEQSNCVEQATIGQGAHGEVRLIQTPQTGTNYAVKSQLIHSPGNLHDPAYNELRIAQELNRLRCDHFVAIVDWYKIRERSFVPASPARDCQVMHYILEYGKNTLNDKLKEGLTMNECKCMLFQLLYALCVAQERLEFNHNDLHAKNILVQNLPSDVYREYTVGPFTWFTTEIMAKLCDFGMSRVKLPEGEVIWSSKSSNKTAYSFDELKDVNSLGAVFHYITIKDADASEQDKQLLRQLKQRLAVPPPPRQLLLDPFFLSLREKPSESLSLYQPPPLQPHIYPSHLHIESFTYPKSEIGTPSANKENYINQSSNSSPLPKSVSNLRSGLRQEPVTPVSMLQDYSNNQRRRDTASSPGKPPVAPTLPSSTPVKQGGRVIGNLLSPSTPTSSSRSRTRANAGATHTPEHFVISHEDPGADSTFLVPRTPSTARTHANTPVQVTPTRKHHESGATPAKEDVQVASPSTPPLSPETETDTETERTPPHAGHSTRAESETYSSRYRARAAASPLTTPTHTPTGRTSTRTHTVPSDRTPKHNDSPRAARASTRAKPHMLPHQGTMTPNRVRTQPMHVRTRSSGSLQEIM